MKETDVSSNILDREDLKDIHDAMYEGLGCKKLLTDDEIRGYWNELPVWIRLEAISYGCNDTVVRDNVFEWLEKKYRGDE